MKRLWVSEIIQQINGLVVNGLDNFKVKRVKKETKKYIENETLLFHLDREPIKGKFWRENTEIAVVSDAIEQFSGLGDNITLIKVENVEDAYWKFIDYYRNLFQIPVIGITGTCGKTSTKEMIAQILEEDYNVQATWASMNSMSVNLRYLLGIDEETEVAVFEMPVCYPGYLRVACRYFQPQIRVLLNIGVHHLADCETPEEYMKAKAEIIDGLDPINGVIILNADDENIRKVLDVSRYRNVIYFGKSQNADFRIEKMDYAKNGMNFTLTHKGDFYEAYVPGIGEHNVYNALAAIAAVTCAGVDIETAIKRLEDFEQVEEHLEFKTGFNGCTVIDDSWNSSPLSMETGLKVLKAVSEKKISIALLGYMPQLGDGPYADDQYNLMGEKAVEANLDLLIVVGKEAIRIGKRALELGMDANKVYFCETGSEVYQALQPFLHDKAMILLKVTHRVMTRPSFLKMKNKLILDE